jgi:predicted permease
MRILNIVKMRLRSLVHRDRADGELEEELKYHLERETQRNLQTGMPPDQARSAALRAMGGVAQIQEECRETRGFGYLEDLAQDLRYAARTMRRSPAMTAVAVLSLALGIGANTAVFSLINAVMLKSLPVARPEELVSFARVYSNRPSGNFSYPHFLQLAEGNAGTADLFATNVTGITRVLAPGNPTAEQATREMVGGEYFNILGVYAVLGRTLNAEDNRMPNGNPVAVISYAYWKRRFGLDPSILGKTLTVSEIPLTVAGVAAPQFFGVEVGSATDIWVPLATMRQKKWLSQRGFNFLRVLGRLKPGVNIAQARGRSEAVMGNIIAESLGPVRNPRLRQELFDQRIVVEPAATGFSRLRDQFSEPLQVLLIIVAGVLLVACSNIANLQLARASAREREIGVRLAIGAGRLRLVRQLLAESVLLSIAGGVCGVGFAYWGCQALLSFLPKSDAPLVVDLHPDARVLGFTLGLALLSGILFGLGPAWRSTRTDLDTALKSEARSVGYNSARRWLGRSLIAGQVALSMVLLTGSGLFIRSLMKLQAVDLGFDREHVVTFGVNVLGNAGGAPQMRGLMDRVVERAQSIPVCVRPAIRLRECTAPGAGPANCMRKGTLPAPMSRRSSTGRWRDRGISRPWALRCCPGGTSPSETMRRRRRLSSSTRAWRAISGEAPIRSAGACTSSARRAAWMRRWWVWSKTFSITERARERRPCSMLRHCRITVRGRVSKYVQRAIPGR